MPDSIQPQHTVPDYACPPAWFIRRGDFYRHTAFLRWLVAAGKPRCVVACNTYFGAGYCALCEAMQRHVPAGVCNAVSTWQSCLHAGSVDKLVLENLYAHHESRYTEFSNLWRCRSDEVVHRFATSTGTVTPADTRLPIDLLCMSNYLTYEAIRDDFELWRSRLSDSAIVVVGGINPSARVRINGRVVPVARSGVARFWDELRQTARHCEFEHGNGLGVLLIGPNPPAEIARRLDPDPNNRKDVRREFTEIEAAFDKLAASHLHSIEPPRKLVAEEQKFEFEHKVANKLVWYRRMAAERLRTGIATASWAVKKRRQAQPASRPMVGVTDQDYEQWIAEYEPGSDALRWQEENAATFDPQDICVSFLLSVTKGTAALAADTLDSIEAQTHAAWEVCLACPDADGTAVDDALRAHIDTFSPLPPDEALGVTDAVLALAPGKGRGNRRLIEQGAHCDRRRHALLKLALTAARGRFIVTIAPGDRISPSLVYEIAACLNKELQADIIFWDEDRDRLSPEAARAEL